MDRKKIGENEEKTEQRGRGYRKEKLAKEMERELRER